MKKQAQSFWMFAHCLAIIASTSLVHTSVHGMGTDLIWTVVTSENDAGPGSFREAINAVNSMGTGTEISPNAIAFANNVRTIKLQSLLPIIEAPVLIDGLALVMNGTVVQEGDCSLLPSPVDDPCSFSCALRVTIDGSTIPLGISPDLRIGLESRSDDVTIRGIRIINITTPEPDSVAIGINLNGENNSVECCEIDNIRNTAGTSSNPNTNFAAGITGSNEYYITKTYIHNIQGGPITFDCDLIGTGISQLVSGSAFGIIGTIHVIDSRVEQVTSGSIVACQPSAFGSEGITLIVGTAVGMTDTPEEFSPESFTQQKDHCPPQASCSECNTCSGTAAPFTVEGSVITNIIGGSVISNIDNVGIFQDLVAGISLGIPTPLMLAGPSLISENSISAIHTGDVTISGNSSEYVCIGSMGILIFGNLTHCIRCNTITDIALATLHAGGSHTQARVGQVHGIFGIIEEPINGSWNVECNTVSYVSGGIAIAEGDCSTLSPPDHLLDSMAFENASLFEKHTHLKQTKNIPSGAACIPLLPVPVSGINITLANELVSIANNTVHSVFGGKRVTQGSGSRALTLGSMGITVGSLPGFGSIIFTSVDTNSVYSIVGPMLIAQAGGSTIQNIQGSVGIWVNSISAEIKNNCVQQIAEGKVQASQNSMVAHFTDFETFTLLQQSKTTHPYNNNAIQNPNATFVPVVTAGISVSNPTMASSKVPQQKQQGTETILIQDNTVTGVTGACVPSGQLPLGSSGVGIFAQPATPLLTSHKDQVTRSNNITKDSRLQRLCASEVNFTKGIITTNNIQAIVGGTNAPAYGIFLDGSQFFLVLNNLGFSAFTTLFTITNNTIKTIKGNGAIQPFSLTNEQLSAVQSCCFDTFGTGTECDLAKNVIPFLPIEPTSGIYTLFGGCSQISSNTITHIADSKTDARGITTAASSDMKIFDNLLTHIKGYGIFVGGSVVDNTLPVTGSEFIIEEVLPSLRNIIYNNSTFNNTNKGIELGLIDWSYFIFARTILNACKNIPLRLHQEPEDSLVTYGNHGQVAPCIKKVTCNSNGRITIEVTLTGTLLLTNFIIQFFKNSSNSVPHGEQHISQFDDPYFVLHTDSNGNAHGQFTFLPVVPVEKGDIISAHVTVQDDLLSPVGNEFFGDTSEFSTNTPTACPVSSLMPPPKPHKPGLARILYRTKEG